MHSLCLASVLSNSKFTRVDACVIEWLIQNGTSCSTESRLRGEWMRLLSSQCVTHRQRRQQQRRPAIRLTQRLQVFHSILFSRLAHTSHRFTFSYESYASLIYQRTNANSHAYIGINCTISIHQFIFKHDTSVVGSRFHSFAHFCWLFVLFIHFNLLFIYYSISSVRESESIEFVRWR